MQQYIALITIAVLSVSGAQACDLAGLQTCVGQMQASAAQIQSGNVGSLGPDAMNQLCGLLSDVSDCFRTAGDGCPSSALLPIQGVIDMVEYMCVDSNKQIMLNNAQCMSESEGDVENCMQSLQNLGSAGQTADSMCSTVRGALSCMHGAIEGHCNKEAADFMRNMIVKPMQPTLSSIDCDLSAGIMNGPCGLLLFLAALLAYISM